MPCLTVKTYITDNKVYPAKRADFTGNRRFKRVVLIKQMGIGNSLYPFVWCG